MTPVKLSWFGLLSLLVMTLMPSIAALHTSLDDAAQQAFEFTQTYMQSVCNNSIIRNTTVVDETEKSLKQYFMSAFADYQQVKALSKQVSIRIQLDSIAMAPDLFYFTDLFTSTSPLYTIQLVPYPTTFTSLSNVDMFRTNLPVDSRWTDFAGSTINDIRAYTSPSNLRQQHHWSYRADILARHNLHPPETWEDLMEVAAALNGTDFNGDGVREYAICFNQLPHCLGPYLLLSIFGSIARYQGPSQGVLFEPETMQPLVLNAAMSRALEIYANLSQYNAPVYSATCWPYSRSYNAGGCALAFATGQFQYSIIPAARDIWGTSSTLLGPGSTYVLDRQLDKLVACTRSLCPHAVASVYDKGKLISYAHTVPAMFKTSIQDLAYGVEAATALVSYEQFYKNATSPFLYAVSASFGIFAIAQATTATASATDGSDSTLNALASSTSQNTSANVAYNLEGSTFKVYDEFISHFITMNTSQKAAMAAPLLALGYHINDTISQLDVVAKVSASRMSWVDVAVPGASYFRLALAEAGNNASQQGANIQLIMSTLDMKYRMVVASFSDADEFKHLYWASIGYTQTTTPQANTTSGANGSVGTAVIVAASVVGSVLVLLAVGGFVAVRLHLTGRTLTGKMRAPGAHASTTLLVSDIQDSTGLWEQLPMHAMEELMAVHHRTMRLLLNRHNGYESATEGDSFILAFHNPQDALAYAVAAQTALLHANWPELLLASSSIAEPCYATAMDTHPEACLSNIVCRLQRSSAPLPSLSSNSWTRRSDSVLLHAFRAARAAPQEAAVVATGAFRARFTALKRTLRFHKAATTENAQAEVTGADNSAMDMLASTPSGSNISAAPASASRVKSCSFGWALSQAWAHSQSDDAPSAVEPQLPPGHRTSPRQGAATTLIWRGLRVRMGLHSGLSDPSLISTNPTSRRTQYSGSFAATAKVVCDAGHGGQILLSHAAFEELGAQLQAMGLCVLEMGMHVLAAEQDPMPIYQAAVPGLEARLQSFPPLRTMRAVTEGVMAATVGRATIVFMNATGVQSLLSWNTEVTRRALHVYHQCVQELLGGCGGYVAELVDGLALVAFQKPLDAVSWALAVQRALVATEWPEGLLGHELCEPVMTTAVLHNEDGEMLEVQKVSMRGLRLKVGIAIGDVMDYVNTTTGHVMYRGRVMNWAARISNLATAGQVLCTEHVWQSAVASSPGQLVRGISGMYAGLHALKGIAIPVSLYSCTHTYDTASHSAWPSASGEGRRRLSGLIPACNHRPDRLPDMDMSTLSTSSHAVVVPLSVRRVTRQHSSNAGSGTSGQVSSLAAGAGTVTGCQAPSPVEAADTAAGYWAPPPVEGEGTAAGCHQVSSIAAPAALLGNIDPQHTVAAGSTSGGHQ